MFKFALLAGCLALVVATSLAASEADDIREKAKAMLKEAATLAEKGHKEEAAQLEAKARELMEVAKRREGEKNADGDPRPDQPSPEALERHLKELVVQEQRARESDAPKEEIEKLRERVAATKARLDAMRAGLKGRPAAEGGPGREAMQKFAEAGERMGHLRAAAEHLRAAGATDLAQQVAQQADQMERELRQAKENLVRQAAERDGGIPTQIEELRREMQRLRAEIEELRRQKAER